MRRVVLFSPYPQATNDHEKEFLAEHGIEVVRDVALNCRAERRLHPRAGRRAGSSSPASTRALRPTASS